MADEYSLEAFRKRYPNEHHCKWCEERGGYYTVTRHQVGGIWLCPHCIKHVKWWPNRWTGDWEPYYSENTHA